MTGAYPLDIDGDGIVDLASCASARTSSCAASATAPFERANEALGFDGGDDWTTAFSATWEDEATLPTLAFGEYLGLDANGEPTTTCADSSLVRPAADGTTYGAPIPLSPGWCTLSILFSDWDRSGRRDLRVSNDRHYYRDGEEQLWRIEAGQPPRPYTADDGWARLQLWGMGIASQDLTGDGYPEVYLTSQGDNKLQALASGDPSRPAYEDMALDRGVTAHRPYDGGDVLPSTAWHPEFADVNNDGFLDLFVSKGNVGTEIDHAMRDPSNLFIGQADGTFVEGAEAAGIMRFGFARGAALADLNLDGLLDLVQVVRNENVELWRNVGVRRRHDADPDGPLAGRGPGPTGREPRCHRGVGGDPHRRPDRPARGDRRRRARERRARLDPPRDRVGDDGRCPRDLAGRRGRAVADDPRRHVRPHRTRGRRPRTVDARRRHAPVTTPCDADPATDRRDTAGTSGCRTRARTSTRPSTRTGVARLRERMDAERYTHLVVWADREHSANLSYLTGFDPRFEEAILIVGRDGEPAILVGNECWGMAGAAPAADAPPPFPGPEPAEPAT